MPKKHIVDFKLKVQSQSWCPPSDNLFLHSTMQKQSEERTIMVMVFSGKILRNIDGQGEISRRGKQAKQGKGFFNLSAYITAGEKNVLYPWCSLSHEISDYNTNCIVNHRYLSL